MSLRDLLSIDRVNCLPQCETRKQALEQLSHQLATANPLLNASDILELLVAREKLGSTAVGHGIAIPHARADFVEEPIGALLSLEQGVDFDAIDTEPVNLFFALLVPMEANNTHLDLLASLAKLFSHEEARAGLRATTNPHTLCDQFINFTGQYNL